MKILSWIKTEVFKTVCFLRRGGKTKLARYRSSSRTVTFMWCGLTHSAGCIHSDALSSLSESVLSSGTARKRITMTKSSRHTWQKTSCVILTHFWKLFSKDYTNFICLPKTVYSTHLPFLVRIAEYTYGSFLSCDAVDKLIARILHDIFPELSQQPWGPFDFDFRFLVLQQIPGRN